MRKLMLFATSCIALVAFLGLSVNAQAFGEKHDPGCDVYGNDRAIHEFTLDTPDSHEQGDVSSVTGGALVCGSSIESIHQRFNSLYDNANIEVANGVVTADTGGLATGRYVGRATVNVLYFLAGVATFESGVDSTLRIEPKTTCQNETQVGGHIPGTIIACNRGDNALGHNFNWTTIDNNGKPWLTIGPMHGILNVEPGLTRVTETLCGYAGAVNGSSCGTSGDWLQKNGSQSSVPQPNCSNGNGIYTVTATQKGGATTPPASTCVPWTDLTPPETTIDSGPTGSGGNKSVSFTFSSNEPGSTFECKLDSGSYASCSSPKLYSGLIDGSHTFYVRATDLVGNTDATPASYPFTVTTKDPGKIIDIPPDE